MAVDLRIEDLGDNARSGARVAPMRILDLLRDEGFITQRNLHVFRDDLIRIGYDVVQFAQFGYYLVPNTDNVVHISIFGHQSIL